MVQEAAAKLGIDPALLGETLREVSAPPQPPATVNVERDTVTP